MDVLTRQIELLWMGAIAACPLAVLVALACRFPRVRPATRHLLWGCVLCSLVTPMLGSAIWRPDWFASSRLRSLIAPEATLPLAQAEPPRVLPRQSSIIQPAFEGRAPREPLASTANLAPTLDFASLPRTARSEPARPRSLARENPFRTPLPSVADASLATIASPASGSTSAPFASSSDVMRPSTIAPAGAPVSAGAPSRASAVVDAALQLRDALVSPPIPAPLWLGGALMLAAIAALRSSVASRWLATSTPASADTTELVGQIARSLGLRRAPRAMLVDAPVSPMVWCGWRPRLLLPRALWSRLDTNTRRVVLVHELAHLRRGDHLVRWIESTLGTLFWWHPVAWWARRRLRDEAELCCDAWVTSLYPAERRTYASALVTTTSFLCAPRGAPRHGLGVAAGSASKLARRITMVMTSSSAPRASKLGIALGALALALSTFVIPGVACPPEEEGAKSGAHVLIAPKPARTRNSARAGTHEAPAANPFLGEAPALEAMRTPHPPEAPEAPAAAAGPNAPHNLYVIPRGTMGPRAIGRGQSIARTNLDDLKAGRSPREYDLPAGRRQSFYSLMSRSDVPILVEMAGDEIVLWGTDAEHEVFGRFVGIIAKGGQHERTRSNRADTGQREMERELARAQASAARAYRSSLEQLRTHREQLQRQLESARKQGDRTRQQSEKQMRELERLMELRRSAADQNDGPSPADRERFERAAREFQAHAQALDGASGAMNANIDHLEQMVRELDERAQAMEAAIAGIADEQLEETLAQGDSDDDNAMDADDDSSTDAQDADDAQEDDEQATVIAPAIGTIVSAGPVAPVAPLSTTLTTRPTPAVAAVAPVPPVAPVRAASPAPLAR